MNYKCNCCGYEFDEPSVFYESHGFTDGMYEKLTCCPNCGGDYTDDFDNPTDEEDCDE